MQKIKDFLGRIWGFLKRYKWSVAVVIIAMITGGFFVWRSYNYDIPLGDMSIIIPQKKPETVAAPLSGRQISPEAAEQTPVAVVVENHPDARPQAGLNSADMVFETTAEGGITRFLAVFQSSEPKMVGPVRSARNYFVDWAYSFGSLFAHVGGSQEAIALINKIDVYDLNQYFFGSYFWRDTARYAPHNVYTTLSKLREAAQTKNYPEKSDNLEAYSFKEDMEEADRPAFQKFTVNFNASFSPTYTYDPKTNSYLRSLNGVKQTDANTKKQIMAKNVVVCFSNLTSQIIRGTGYTMIDTTDVGTAYYYIDGFKTTGKWSRADGKQIKFYDTKGDPVEFNVGTTWIDFVSKGTSVK